MTITLILSAGKSTRFAQAGYPYQKPMLPMPDGRCLLEWHLDRLPDGHKIFVGRREHQKELWGLLHRAELKYGNLTTVWLSKNVKGPLDTAWAVKNMINKKEPLVIAYNDDFVSSGKLLGMFLQVFMIEGRKAALTAFESDDDRFGKIPGLPGTVCGPVYFFRSGKDFVKLASKLKKGPENGIPDVVFASENYNIFSTSVINLGTWQEYSDWMTAQGHNVQHLIGGKQ